MNTKNLFSILLLVAMCFVTSYAQQAKLDRANNEFKKYNYKAAIPFYKEILDKADIPEAKVKLAECFRRTDNWKEAEYWYGQVVNLPDAKSIYYLYYGMALQANGKCDIAREFFREYSRLEPDDGRGALLARACTKDELETILNKCNSCYEIVAVPINTKYDDFGPVLFGDGLLFTSERDDKGVVDRIHEWTGYPFLEIYYSNIDTLDAENFEFTYESEPREYTGKINTKFHDGPVAFSKDQNTIFITRNNFFDRTRGRDDEGVTRLKIFVGKRDGERWDKLEGLPFNSDEYSVAHPSISDDGNTLYFSSDMPGGFGGMDLYSSTYEDGTWGPPTNLGPTVNTEGHEVFPNFQSSTNRLYFSSDGQVGLGALDIYSTSLVDEAWTAPSNVGAPLNSKYDDHSVVLNDEETFGYFSSNRPGGKGRDDIYSFRKKVVNVEILVFDQATNLPIPEAGVFNDCSKENLKTGSNGKIMIEMPLDKCCKFFASKEEYDDNDMEGCTDGYEPGSKMFVKIPLSKPLEFNMAGVITDKMTGEPIAGATVFLTNDCDQPEREFITGADGQYLFENLHNKCCYNVRVTKDEENEANPALYLVTEESKRDKICTRGQVVSMDFEVNLQLTPIIYADTEEGVEETVTLTEDDIEPTWRKIATGDGNFDYIDENNVVVAKVDENGIIYAVPTGGNIEGGTILTTFTLYHIYYDFDKYYIRDDAQEDLNTLFTILEDNPRYVVEIGSHTDARGTNSYNYRLSKKRAKSVVNWLVEKGIPRDRLTYVGYGEDDPTNDCINEVPCTEEQHQRNRRTEFRVIGTIDGDRFDTVERSMAREDVRTDPCVGCPF